MSSVGDTAMELLDEQAELYVYLKNFIVNSIDKAKVADRNKFAYERRLEILNQYWQTYMKNNLKLSNYHLIVMTLRIKIMHILKSIYIRREKIFM